MSSSQNRVTSITGLTVSNIVPKKAPTPVRENTVEFTVISAAAYRALVILNKPQAKATLAELGRAVVQGWGAQNPPVFFQGDVNSMPIYVTRFVAALQNGFPELGIEDLKDHNIVACTTRMPWPMQGMAGHGAAGTLATPNPRAIARLSYNLSKVRAMVAAERGTVDKSSTKKKMMARFHTYLFMFTLATVHELTHLFVAYLAQGSLQNTPPQISYLNYGFFPEEGSSDQPLGESGRWLEGRLWGGSIEFYRDVNDDNAQCGIPFVFGPDYLARRVNPTTISNLITNTEEYNQFPLGTTGHPLTTQQRQAQGLLSLGNTQNMASQSGSFMKGRQDWPEYKVSAADLKRVGIEPGFIVKAVRVR